MTIRGWNMLPN